GLEAAAALADEWPEDTPFPLIVFVTAYDQYALQAFERAAVDYVLKPVQRERLAQTCTRLQAALRQRAQPAPAGVSLDAVMQQLRGLMAAAPGHAEAPRLPVFQAGAGNANHLVLVDQVLSVEA